MIIIIILRHHYIWWSGLVQSRPLLPPLSPRFLLCSTGAPHHQGQFGHCLGHRLGHGLHLPYDIGYGWWSAFHFLLSKSISSPRVCLRFCVNPSGILWWYHRYRLILNLMELWLSICQKNGCTWATINVNVLLLFQVGLSGGLLFVVHAMYQCLVNYTGAVPAEFYSIKKRPVGWLVVPTKRYWCTITWTPASWP